MASLNDFDILGARNSGYSNDQIYDFLKQNHSNEFDFDGAEKAGASKSYIIDFLSQNKKPNLNNQTDKNNIRSEEPNTQISDLEQARQSVLNFANSNETAKYGVNLGVNYNNSHDQDRTTSQEQMREYQNLRVKQAKPIIENRHGVFNTINKKFIADDEVKEKYELDTLNRLDDFAKKQGFDLGVQEIDGKIYAGRSILGGRDSEIVEVTPDMLDYLGASKGEIAGGLLGAILTGGTSIPLALGASALGSSAGAMTDYKDYDDITGNKATIGDYLKRGVEAGIDDLGAGLILNGAIKGLGKGANILKEPLGAVANKVKDIAKDLPIIRQIATQNVERATEYATTKLNANVDEILGLYEKNPQFEIKTIDELNANFQKTIGAKVEKMPFSDETKKEIIEKTARVASNLTEALRHGDTDKARDIILKISMSSENGGAVISEILKSNGALKPQAVEILTKTINDFRQVVKELGLTDTDTWRNLIKTYKADTKAEFGEMVENIGNAYQGKTAQISQDKINELANKAFDISQGKINQSWIKKQFSKMQGGKSFDELNALRAELNDRFSNLFTKELGYSEREALNLVNDIKATFDNAIDDILRQKPNLYQSARKAYDTALSDYGKMKKANTMSFNKTALKDEALQSQTTEQVLKALDNQGQTFKEYIQNLPKELQEKAELYAVRDIIESAIKKTDDGIEYLDGAQALKNLKKLDITNTQAKQFLEIATDLSKISKGHANVGEALSGIKYQGDIQTLATSGKGVFKQVGFRNFYNIVQRNLPFGEKAGARAYQYHLEQALKNSRTIGEFTSNLSTILKDNKVINSGAREALNKFMQELENEVIKGDNFLQMAKDRNVDLVEIKNGGMSRQHPSTHTTDEKILPNSNLKLNKAREQIINNTDLSKLNAEQKEIYEVLIGTKEKAVLQGKDINDIFTLEQGSRNAGAKKILIKHGGVEKTGGLETTEMLDMMKVVRDGKLLDDSFEMRDNLIRYAYELDGTPKLRLVVDEFNSGKKVFDLYSDRNFIDYGTTAKHATAVNEKDLARLERVSKKNTKDFPAKTEAKTSTSATLGYEPTAKQSLKHGKSFNDDIIPQKTKEAQNLSENAKVKDDFMQGIKNATDNGTDETLDLTKMASVRNANLQGDELVKGDNFVKSQIKDEQTAKVITENLATNKDLAIKLQPKADILQMVQDFKEPIKTPIFEAKISMDKMLNHLAEKGAEFDRRIELINLVKPTLENPLFIAKNGDRYQFFKTFLDDNDKTIKFLSVIENDKGEFLGITITKLKNTDLKNLVKGDIIWGGDTLSELSTPQIAKINGSEAIDDIIPQKTKQAEILLEKQKNINEITKAKFDENLQTALKNKEFTQALDEYLATNERFNFLENKGSYSRTMDENAEYRELTKKRNALYNKINDLFEIQARKNLPIAEPKTAYEPPKPKSQTELKAEFDDLAEKYDIEQFLKDRENISSNDIRYTRTAVNGSSSKTSRKNADGTYTYSKPEMEHNYKADFAFTKQDTARLRMQIQSGEFDENLLNKLKNDLDGAEPQGYTNYLKSADDIAESKAEKEFKQTGKEPEIKELKDGRIWDNKHGKYIYMFSNESLGGGVLGGSVSGIQTDENGNIIGFDPADFAKGFIGGAIATKALKETAIKGAKIYADKVAKTYPNIAKSNPKLFAEIVNKTAKEKFGNLAVESGEILQKGIRKLIGEAGNLNKSVIGGEKALLSLKDSSHKANLAKAKELANKGSDELEIWEKTGWYKDELDGKWKFEINPSGGELKRNVLKYGKAYKLSEVLDDKELFEAYPQLSEVKVITSNNLQNGFAGSFNQETKIIKIASNNANIKNTLYHEIQHAVQEIENFSKGSNLDNPAIKNYARTKNLAEYYDDKIKEHYKKHDEIIKKYGVESKEFKNWADELEHLGRKFEAQLKDESYETYLRQGGEAEARNVSNRLNGGDKNIQSFDDFVKLSKEQGDNFSDSELRQMYLNLQENTKPTHPLETLDIPRNERLNLGGDGVSEARNLPNKEKRGIYNVAFNDKKSTQIYKDLDDIEQAIKFEKGRADTEKNGKIKSGFGALHIKKHTEPNKFGYVTTQEYLNMGEVVRKGEMSQVGQKRVYKLTKDGVTFRVVIGDSKNKKERIISFYSDRKAK